MVNEIKQIEKFFHSRDKATDQTLSPVEVFKVRKIEWSSSSLKLLLNIMTIRKKIRKWF